MGRHDDFDVLRKGTYGPGLQAWACWLVGSIEGIESAGNWFTTRLQDVWVRLGDAGVTPSLRVLLMLPLVALAGACGLASLPVIIAGFTAAFPVFLPLATLVSALTSRHPALLGTAVVVAATLLSVGGVYLHDALEIEGSWPEVSCRVERVSTYDCPPCSSTTSGGTTSTSCTVCQNVYVGFNTTGGAGVATKIKTTGTSYAAGDLAECRYDPADPTDALIDWTFPAALVLGLMVPGAVYGLRVLFVVGDDQRRACADRPERPPPQYEALPDDDCGAAGAASEEGGEEETPRGSFSVTAR